MNTFVLQMLRVSLLLTASVTNVWAHGGHDTALRISAATDQIRLAISIPAASLHQFDADANGVLSKAEFRLAQDQIEDWFDERFQLIDHSGESAEAIFFDMPVTDFDELSEQDPVDQVRFFKSFRRPVHGAAALRWNGGLKDASHLDFSLTSGSFKQEGTFTTHSSQLHIPAVNRTDRSSSKVAESE